MKKVYNKVKNDEWAETDVCMAVIARYGTGGGNIPLVVDTLVFDEGQITCPTNGMHPTWGGCATASRATQEEA